MLDGSGHFVSDTVNLDIWHRMHKLDNKDVIFRSWFCFRNAPQEVPGTQTMLPEN